MLRSLRSRVALAFGGVVIAVVGALSLVLGHMTARRMLADQAVALDTLARSTADVLADGLAERLREVELLAASPPASPADWQRVMARAQQSRPRFSWMGLVEPDGRVRHATGDLLVGESVAERPWFIAARAAPVVGDVHTAKLLAARLPASATGEPLRFIDFAAPVRADGRLQAVIGVHVSWDWARDVIGRLRSPLARHRGVTVFILDHRGEVILRPLGLDGPERPIALDQLPADGARAVRWADRSDHLTAAARLPSPAGPTDMGWTIVARQPVAQALAPARAARHAAWAIGAVAALLATVLAWLALGRYTRPLAQMAEAARQVEAGDRVTEIRQHHGAAELRQLSASLRGMTASLRQREQALAEANRVLEARVAERTRDLLHAQSALQQANAELQALASRDALTGLFNRRLLDERLAAELARHRRSGRPLAVVLADIDHFKAVNDGHGHAEGDRVLRDVARCLQGTVRGTDIVGRYGGEEFLLLLPDTPAEGALAACEKLRAVVAACPGAVRVTISLGIAVPAADWPDAAAVLAAADAALYRAKAEGRNRVVLQGPAVATRPDQPADAPA
ncbi:diguanylate cyclase [Aquabacterium sp. J223]|uniref:sensor domain-containing diguanylate cyclase n=1 Tax=Aquabacterium sp. J223 TaxID=2898431 RepID=UPI0021ADED58|nr:diguanylate cyclase [Aquabacterium sp. J223]UUX96882.1 diguanylate cyclase [Aquabacterium sp. J223]